MLGISLEGISSMELVIAIHKIIIYTLGIRQTKLKYPTGILAQKKLLWTVT
jgi:hypothetical protein